MMAIEKSRPLVAQETGQAVETKTACEAVYFSNDYFTTSEGNGQVTQLYDLIPCGRANAVTGKQLMEITGARDLRSISKGVELIRRSGTPVCATTGKNPGYFRPETAKELLNYVRSFNRRLREMRRTLEALEAVAQSMEGQIVIAGWSDDGGGHNAE